MSRKLRVGGATVNQTPIDWTGNTQRIIEAIGRAREIGIELLCFPEMSIPGYGCEDLFLAEWVTAKSWEQLSIIKEHCNGIAVVVGLPVRMDGLTYNGAAVISDQQILGVTLKQNMARDGVHYEPRWFDAWRPGTTTRILYDGREIQVGDLTYELNGVSFAFEICEDAWRKVRPAEAFCRKHVDLILNPSASHFAMSKAPSREQLVNESSAQFNCVYGYVNLLGNEAGRMIYDGDILFSRKGKLIFRSRRLSLQPFVVGGLTIDFEDANERYAPLEQDIESKNEEFAQATSLALFDYLRKSKSKGYVVSLSGGADSACCAVIVTEMVRRVLKQLGPGVLHDLGYQGSEKEIVKHLLTCAYQASANSSTTTLDAAKAIADDLGTTFHHWQIEDEVQSYQGKIAQVIGRSLEWKTDDIAMQNIQARARSPIIWMLANIKKSILLTTSNRSEGDVGYATMDGDTSGSLAPIAGVDKPFVLQWLRWAEKELHYPGLNLVNNLQPTAELRPVGQDQTDEKDLMPYDVLVAIEKAAIRDRQSPRQVFNLLSPKMEESHLKRHIVKFFRLWAQNQWKRERLAPSFHLDDLNVDPRSWCRFPILSGAFQEELKQLEG
ncbi:MAG: NAD(+) synthase [Cyclobacteriaceae bacterium]